MRIVGPETIL